MVIRAHSHDNRGPLPDKGPTPATTIIGEILGSPKSNRGVRPHGRNSKIQEVSQHSESRTPNVKGEQQRGRRSGRSRSMSGSPESTSVFSRIRHGRSESPRHRPVEQNESPENVIMKEHVHKGQKCSPKVKIAGGGGVLEVKIEKAKVKHWKGRPITTMAAAKVEWWAMPTWYHMFNSTLTGSARAWFDDLPTESMDSYDDLKKAFRANFLQQNKYIKDLVEIHHIKQKEGESIKDFMQRFKAKSRHVKGAPECMRIYGFMHGITNLKLIKHLHNKIPKSVDEMMRQKEAGRKQNFETRGDFRNQQRSKWRRDKFTLLTKSPKEILALDKGKFKTPPPMTTPIGKRNNNKFCEFHGEVGHNTDECMHLRRQIKELIKAGKLSHVINKLKQGAKRINQKHKRMEKHPERISL
ncbi:reverse transcriptase domain-containing protein [Tanacetum coccineum]